MPLHPEVAAFVQAFAGAPPLEGLPLEEVRRLIALSWAVPGPARALARVEEVRVAGLPARLYCATARTPVRVVAYFHGGGWAAGDLEAQDPCCRELAAALGDVAVVSVDYRRPPEHPWPAAAEDAFAAVRWLAQEGGALGLAGDVSVAGSSAGGNLAAAAALLARERGGPGLRAQVLHCPILEGALDTPSHRALGEGYVVTTGTLEWFWSLYVPDPARRRDPLASPLRAPDLRGLPRTLIQTAEFDPLRDEGEAYARRLQEAGVPTVLSRLDGHIHDPWNTFAVQPGGRAALEEAAAFLQD